MNTLLDKKCDGKFYDLWESKTPEERNKIMSEALDSYIAYAAEKFPFYHNRFAHYEKNSSFPLARIPVLNAIDLREVLPPKSNSLVFDPGNNFTVFQSGGTTGTPKTTLFSNRELDLLDLPNARGFYALGLSKEDRVGNLFAVGSLYMTFVHINRMLQQYGCMNFPFSNHTGVEFVHTVVKQFKINCLTGISSVVLSALRAMAHIDATDIKIDKVFFGGEHLYEADKREIMEKFGTKTIAAPGYGTVDSWYIGYQCLHCPTGVFHVHDDQCYMEVVNEETGKHCSSGEVGMLYATALPRLLTPIIRYRVGDRAKWLKESCVCGRTTPLFQLLGRGDDVLRIGYDSIDYNAIQECVLLTGGLLGTIQIEKKREKGKDRLIIRVETEKADSFYSELSDKLEKNILQSRPALSDFMKKGTVWPLKIELFAPGTLPTNPRTGKLIRVIDAI